VLQTRLWLLKYSILSLLSVYCIWLVGNIETRNPGVRGYTGKKASLGKGYMVHIYLNYLG